jgi:hypothetical protein
MPDSKTPQLYPAPAEPDLLRRVAELESETVELLAEVRERIHRSWALLQVAEHLRDSYGRPGAVTSARPP